MNATEDMITTVFIKVSLIVISLTLFAAAFVGNV